MSYIRCFLDNDQYKFTMQNAVCSLYPRAFVRYEFFNRGKSPFPEGFGKELKRIIEDFRGLELTKEDSAYLTHRCYYLNPVYIDFLKGYRYNPEEVSIEQEGPNLKVKIEGFWYRTILWEVPLMALISQLYFEMTNQKPVSRDERKKINKEKAEKLGAIGIKVADFGTRRRFSMENHDEVIGDFIQYGNKFLMGSSNMDIAQRYDLNPIGTQAHEWAQFHAAFYGFKMANVMAMKRWTDCYQGNLGIALPDTFTTKVFLNSFDSYYARLFDGVRHDSGDPIIFIKEMVRHYDLLRISGESKTLVFSDNLKDCETINNIHRLCKSFVKDSYGIGTWFTNDVGVTPMNMVIKMTGVLFDGDWVNTIKLSDDPLKNTGDPETIKLCKLSLNLK